MTNPENRITNIDAFLLSLDDYAKSVYDSRPSIRARFNAPASLLGDPKPWVHLITPWQEMPPSIQRVMGLQYPSASRTKLGDELGTVGIRICIPDGYVSFTLKSDSVVEKMLEEKTYYTDKVGGVVIPNTGLRLLLTDRPTVPKGHWFIVQRPTDERGVEDILSDFAYPSAVRPTTLQELHDIVRILDSKKNQAAWGTTKT